MSRSTGNVRSLRPHGEAFENRPLALLARFDQLWEAADLATRAEIRARIEPPAVAPRPSSDLNPAARRVLEFLNARRPGNGRGFRHVECNLELIRARLASGITEQDLRQIIVRKCRDAERGDFNPRYLRPATLFNRLRCEQYLGELGS